MIELRNLKPGEKVIKIINVHWIAYVILGFFAFITLLISIMFHVFLGFTAFSFLMTTMLWIIAIIIFYIQWLNYELDKFIITNTRIIGVEQISFLNRSVSECNLAQVQEVNSQTKGLFPNLMNYGSVSIQTAGNATTLSMQMCPDAIQEARIILNLVETYKDTRMKNMIENEAFKTRGNITE